jgi:hypothetical protein
MMDGQKETHGPLGGCEKRLLTSGDGWGERTWYDKGDLMQLMTEVVVAGICGKNCLCPTCATKLKKEHKLSTQVAASSLKVQVALRAERDEAQAEAATNALTAKAFKKEWQEAKDEARALREDMEAWHPFSAQDIIDERDAYKARWELFCSVINQCDHGQILDKRSVDTIENKYPLPAESQGGADEQKQD